MEYKYVSIDIETTGLDDNRCQILSVGAIYDDLESPLDKLPRYYTPISHLFIVGEPFALNLNAELLLAEGVPAETAIMGLCDFIRDNEHGEKPNLCGKNFAGFDALFLRKYSYWRNLRKSHRVLDPGSLYLDPKKDKEIPNLDECMVRAGVEGCVTHNALDDALDVVKVVRHYYGVPV